MSSFTNLISLTVGLVAGNVFGVYLAQTYELPDLHQFLENLMSQAKRKEKTSNDGDKRDGSS